VDSDAAPEVVVPLSKVKVALHLLGAIVFVAAGIWIWWIADTQGQLSSLLMKAVAVADVAFFGLAAIYLCVKVLDTRPGLVIDSHGIVDNSNAVAAGRIFWHDIVGLRVSESAGQRFITIEVVNAERFVTRGNRLRQMLNAANTKMTGSPINISSNSLQVKFDDLVQVLADAFEKFKLAERTGGER
jgi:hypothetical protein